MSLTVSQCTAIEQTLEYLRQRFEDNNFSHQFGTNGTCPLCQEALAHRNHLDYCEDCACSTLFLARSKCFRPCIAWLRGYYVSLYQLNAYRRPMKKAQTQSKWVYNRLKEWYEANK